MTRSSGNASVHERTLVKIQDSLEQALSGIREELQKMEQVVDKLREALFQVDLLLANPSSAMRYVSNPVGVLVKSPLTKPQAFVKQEALKHISTVYDSHLAALIEKREVLADYVAEEITGEQLAAAFQQNQAIASGNAAEMDDLLAGMNAFGQSDSLQEVNMA
jgi:hypothetical protein